MSYYTLAIQTLGHDASVALFEDEKLIFFLQAERATRKKNDVLFNLKPFEYIRNKITKKIDLLVAHGFKTMNTLLPEEKSCMQIYDKITQMFEFGKIIETSERRGTINLKNDFTKYSHHCSHAISAFYMSPFDEAVCLIVDALGSGYVIQNPKNNLGVGGSENTSILEIDSRYRRNYLYKKSQCGPVYVKDSIPVFSSNGGISELIDPKIGFDKIPYKFDASAHMDIGNMYETITRHLKMGANGYGKVMGLSAYGKADNNLPPFLIGDTIYSNNNLFGCGRELNYNLYPELFEELTFQQKADLAYEVQRALEKVFLHHAQFIKENSKIRNLIVGGGCALNILGVSIIKEKHPEFNIFVDPIANDATHSIGLGIHHYNVERMQGTLIKKPQGLETIYLGPEYDLNELEQTIEHFMNEAIV
jgi:carbamoyltransferase